MTGLLDHTDDAPGLVDWEQEWCEQCTASDDPADAGMPVLVLYTDLDVDDNDEYVEVTELSCGHDKRRSTVHEYNN